MAARAPTLRQCDSQQRRPQKNRYQNLCEGMHSCGRKTSFKIHHGVSILSINFKRRTKCMRQGWETTVDQTAYNTFISTSITCANANSNIWSFSCCMRKWGIHMCVNIYDIYIYGFCIFWGSATLSKAGKFDFGETDPRNIPRNRPSKQTPKQTP